MYATPGLVTLARKGWRFFQPGESRQACAEAIFGWSGGTMASYYTRSADRKRLSLEAMHKLANDQRTSIPAPFNPVRAREEKGK